MNDDENPTRSTGSDGSTARYRWDGERAPSVAIVEAVAEVSGEDPAAMPPLQGAVDMDAIESLIAEPAENSVRISFEYVGAEVTVDPDGVIEVSEA